MKRVIQQRGRAVGKSMKTSQSVCKAVVLALYGILCIHSARAQGFSLPNTVLTDKDAYLLLPPELIAGPVVESRSISPDGQNVAVLRRSMKISPINIPSAEQPHPPLPFGEQELIFWNASARKPVSLWQSNRPFTRVTLSDWMPNTETLFALVDEETPPDGQQAGQMPVHEWKLLLLDRALERARPVAIPLGNYSSIQLDISPLQPLGVLHMYSAGSVQNPAGPDQNQVLYLIHRNGSVGVRINVPPGGTSALVWDTTGNPFFIVFKKDNGPVQRSSYSVDLRTGETHLLEKEPKRADPVPTASSPLPFRLVSQRKDVAEADTTAHIQPVWIQSTTASEKPRSMLTADGSDARLLPDAVGAVFDSQGASWFTPFLKMNKAQYLTLRRNAQRITVISNAKQLGLAALMYTQDYDEVLPGPDNIQDKLTPYLKNDSLFEGFHYTFPGGRLADIEKPAETILGNVEGPGGHAIIYVDGHVKWIDN